MSIIWDELTQGGYHKSDKGFLFSTTKNQEKKQDPLGYSTRVSRGRLIFVALIMLLAYLAVAQRLVHLSTTNVAHLEINTQNSPGIPTPYKPKLVRANILDRNGDLLASTINLNSAYIDPRLVKHPEKTAHAILKVLPSLDHNTLLARLKHPTAHFQWVKRGLSPKEAQSLNALGIAAVKFIPEPHRVYPYANLFSHIVGHTDIDNNGIAGLEKEMNGTLLDIAEPVQTALDLRIQHIVRDELQKQINTFDAIGGSAVLMDVDSSEILALVSLPGYNPNKISDSNPKALFNMATNGVYELGSVFKLFTVANALETGAVSPQEQFDVSRPLIIGGAKIDDYHRVHQPLTMAGILQESSNIGAVKIANRIGSKEQERFLKNLGFTLPADVQLPEVGTPITPNEWRPIRSATISYGHGISVSPLQVTTAVAAMVNGGLYREPTLLKQKYGEERTARQVISSETSYLMRRYMEQVVTNGTGRNAAVKQYRVGGKTGTADKPGSGSYNEEKRIATFVAAFPIDKPQFALTVVIDEPKAQEHSQGFATAGWVAAPVAKRIITRVASSLGLHPSEVELNLDANPLGITDTTDSI